VYFSPPNLLTVCSTVNDITGSSVYLIQMFSSEFLYNAPWAIYKHKLIQAMFSLLKSLCYAVVTR